MFVCLVGFMASGKSTVGPLLAGRLGCGYADLDEVIARRTGRAPAEWLRTEGEVAFRAVETEALTSLLAERRAVVISCGGGVVTVPGNLEAMQAAGKVVWLRASLAACLTRAGVGGDRPLLGDKAAAAALLNAREPLYARADLAVETDGISPAEVAEQIARRLEEDAP